MKKFSRNEQAKRLAEKIADDLFQNGASEIAERLILELPDGRIGGSWSRIAAEGRIEKILMEEFEGRFS